MRTFTREDAEGNREEVWGRPVWLKMLGGRLEFFEWGRDIIHAASGRRIGQLRPGEGMRSGATRLLQERIDQLGEEKVVEVLRGAGEKSKMMQFTSQH